METLSEQLGQFINVSKPADVSVPAMAHLIERWDMRYWQNLAENYD